MCCFQSVSFLLTVFSLLFEYYLVTGEKFNFWSFPVVMLVLILVLHVRDVSFLIWFVINLCEMRERKYVYAQSRCLILLNELHRGKSCYAKFQDPLEHNKLHNQRANWVYITACCKILLLRLSWRRNSPCCWSPGSQACLELQQLMQELSLELGFANEAVAKWSPRGQCFQALLSAG